MDGSRLPGTSFDPIPCDDPLRLHRVTVTDALASSGNMGPGTSASKCSGEEVIRKNSWAFRNGLTVELPVFDLLPCG